MKKLNCWEFKKCGRQAGGNKVHEFGVCPSATEQELNGVHGGKNAGRACWAIAGSFCGGKVQGTYAKKLRNCWDCEFMQLVNKEEGSAPFGFSFTNLGMTAALKKELVEKANDFYSKEQAQARALVKK